MRDPCYLARPVNPFLFNRINAHDPVRATVGANERGQAVIIDDRGCAHDIALACREQIPRVGTAGAFGWDAHLGIVFLTDAELSRREDARKAAAIARERAAVERTERIRRDHPIVISDGDDVLDVLLKIRARRYAIYRRAVGTAEVEGTSEPFYEVAEAICAYVEAVRLALPFSTEVWYAINSFSGGFGGGANHITPIAPLKRGRLERRAGEPLCRRDRGRRHGGFFELVRVDDEAATCTSCARLAERMIDRRPSPASTSLVTSDSQ